MPAIVSQTIDLSQWTPGEDGKVRGTDKLGNLGGGPQSPTDIRLSRPFCRVDAGLNAQVGAIIVTDVDSASHTVTLVAGVGDTNNASFNISGTSLRCNDPATLGIGTYSVRIQADDGTSTPFSKALTVEVLPAITGYGFIGAAVRPVTETVTESVTE